MTSPRPASRRPEPGRFWIAHMPRRWPGVADVWIDLAAAALCLPNTSLIDLPRFDAARLDDLIYLPPVPSALRPELEQVAQAWAEGGAALLCQLRPGEAPPPWVTPVYDILSCLLAGDLAALERLPPQATVVWPLLAGLTDGEELLDRGLGHLRKAGVGIVYPVAPELTPAVRRHLVERCGEAHFDDLFHGRRPSERSAARRIHQRGFEVFPSRPASGSLPRRRRNRQMAAALGLAAELIERLEGPVARSQALWRATRGAEDTPHDLVAVAEDGNLSVMDWLDPTLVPVLAELALEGRSALLEDLLGEYLEG